MRLAFAWHVAPLRRRDTRVASINQADEHFSGRDDVDTLHSSRALAYPDRMLFPVLAPSDSRRNLLSGEDSAPYGLAHESQRHCVLIVDDDDDVRDALRDLLADEGYAVLTAADGAEALATAKRSPPSVILLDLMMPVLNGWQFWDAHQASPELSRIPLVVITATGLGPGALGKVPVLRKPFDVDKLLGIVQRACAS